MNNILYFVVFYCLFFYDVSASYLENIKKCNTGSDCFIYERKDSEIVDMIIIIKHSGDAYEEKNGLNDFAISMINMGSKNYSYRDFHNKLNDLSTVFNLSSDDDNTYIYIRSLRKNFSESMGLAFEAFFDANFSQENFQLVKNNLLSAVKESSHNYQYLASQNFLKEIFKGQIYEAKILTEDDVNSITIEDIKNYIDNALSNVIPTVVLSGDLTSEEIKNNLDKQLMHFGKNISLNKENDKTVTLNLFSKSIYVKDNVKKAQTIIHFAQKIPKLSEKDFVIMTLVNDYIGGGGLNSKLMKKLREEMNITYSVRTAIVNLEKINYMSGSLATGSKDITTILSEITKIFKHLKESGVTESELSYLKKKFYGKRAMTFSNNGSSLFDLSFLVKHNLPLDFYHTNDEIVKNLTVKDIHNTVKKYIDDENLSFVIFN